MDLFDYQGRASRVNAMQRKTLEDMLALAKVCAAENSTLKNKKNKDEFMGHLEMSPSTFSKYVKIGNKSILHLPEFVASMPATFEVLRLLSDQKSEDLAKWLDDGKVHKRMIARDVQQLMGTANETAGEERLLLRIFVGPNAPKEETDAFLKEVQELQDKYAVRFKNENVEKAKRERAYERYDKLVTAYVRKGAERHIKHLRDKHAMKYANLSASARRARWQFKEDEIALDKFSDLSRIKDVLELVGSGDVYDELFKEATSAHEQVMLDSARPLLSELPAPEHQPPAR